LHDDDAKADVTRKSGVYSMSFTIIRRRKPKPPIPLHRYMYRACRDIEHITHTALTCVPRAEAVRLNFNE
jgi:hypothetical protein